MNRYDREIVTQHVYPPIPLRMFDWCAFRDGDEENPSRIAWGPTEDAAVSELMAMEEADKTDEAYEANRD